MDINFPYIILVLVVILISMVLHELMHGLMAYWLGDDTAKVEGRLTLNPIKHLDPVLSLLLPLLLAIGGGPIFGGAKPVPINTRNLKGKEWGFALVAIVGPLTNLALAFLGFVVGHISKVIYVDLGFWSLFVSTWIMVNLGFAVFNMIPIPPLDGSRVLYAFAPDFVRKVLMQIEQFGIVVVLGLFFFFGSVFSGYMNTAITLILDMFRWLMW